MTQDQKSLLSDLYDAQPLTTDDLHHTTEFEDFCGEFNAAQKAAGSKAYSTHDIYAQLILLRKNGELTPKTSRRPRGNDNANT